MSVENPLWGAQRNHGELLKLGFEVAQSSVAKYMVKRRGPPGQGWRTFLRNHAPEIAAMDLFVVPTIGFDLLYAFVIVRLDRRDLVWIPMSQERVDFVQRQDRFLNGRFSRKAAVRWLNTSRCHGAVPSSLAFKAPECRHPQQKALRQGIRMKRRLCRRVDGAPVVSSSN
jgi:hypothetical protein